MSEGVKLYISSENYLILFFTSRFVKVMSGQKLNSRKRVKRVINV